MKYRSMFSRIILFIIILLFCQCENFDQITGFSDVGVEEIQKFSAVFILKLGDVNEPEKTEFGFCWGLNPEPSVYDSLYSFGLNPIINHKYIFTCATLTADTIYYLRAFARKGRTMTYSKEIKFSTSADKIIQNPDDLNSQNYKTNLMLICCIKNRNNYFPNKQ